MLDYYEMKALDIDDEENEEQDDQDALYKEIKDENTPESQIRKASWERNLMQADNLNDSRHNDFDGFEEYFQDSWSGWWLYEKRASARARPLPENVSNVVKWRQMFG